MTEFVVFLIETATRRLKETLMSVSNASVTIVAKGCVTTPTTYDKERGCLPCVICNYPENSCLLFSRKYWMLWVSHGNTFVTKYIARKRFSSSQAVVYFGSFLALFGGISLLSLMQLLLILAGAFVSLKKADNENAEIPSLETRNVFHVLTDKLYHVKKDISEYVKMSSISGVRNLAGSFREKIFWLAIISTAAAMCVHFVRDSFAIFNQKEVFLEYDYKTWSVNEVLLTQLKFLMILSEFCCRLLFQELFFVLS